MTDIENDLNRSNENNIQCNDSFLPNVRFTGCSLDPLHWKTTPDHFRPKYEEEDCEDSSPYDWYNWLILIIDDKPPKVMMTRIMITGVNVGDDNSGSDALPLSILHKSFVIFDNDFDRGNQADKEMSFLTPAFQTGRLRWQIWWFPWLIFLETGNRWFTHSGGGLCQGKSMATNMKSKYHYQCQGVPMSARISHIFLVWDFLLHLAS